MASDVLPPEIHRALGWNATAQDATTNSTVAQNPTSELKLGPLEGPIMTNLRPVMLRGCAAVGLSMNSDIDFELRLLAISEGGAAHWECNFKNTFLMIYHCFTRPKGFSGVEALRLFDREPGSLDPSRKAFRDIEIDDNSALFFAGDVASAGLPIRCQSTENPRLFVLMGVGRQGTLV